MSKQSSHNGPLSGKFDDYEFEPNNSAWDSIESALNSDENSAPLGEKFSNDLEPVSVDVWVNIERELHPEKKRRFIVWWTGVAAGLVSVLFLLNLNSNTGSTQSSLGNEKASSTNNLSLTNSQGNTESEKLGMSPKGKVGKEEYVQKEVLEPASKSEFMEQKSVQGAAPISIGELEMIDENSVFEALRIPNKLVCDLKTPELQIWIPTVVTSEDLFVNEKEEKSANSSHRIQLGLSPVFALENEKMDMANETMNFSSNPTGGFNSTSTVSIDSLGNVIPDSTNTVILNSYSSPVNSTFVPNSSVSVNEAKEYRRPFSFGFIYRYDLNEIFTLSSGIEYTRSSYNYSEGYWKAFDRKGTKGYLGVPILISGNLLNRNRLQLYPLLGAKVFRGIYGKETYSYEAYSFATGSNEIVQKEEDVEDLGYGLSSSIGIGAQIKLYKKLNFYVQTSTEYILKSPVDSYWEENPISFAFQTGLSIKL